MIGDFLQGREGSVHIYRLGGVQHVPAIRTHHKGFCRGDACNSRLALPYGDAGIKMYDFKGDEIGEVSNGKDATGGVTAMTFASTDGETLLAAYEGGQVCLWSIEGEQSGMTR